ncbi:maturation protein [ssRNA phage SRR6960803_13]|uniref:Maturation protein n=1 Tax=ssRNA phage SRR6960803_13 TaxID=2786616 RepID=A0A8S5L554_9VIRU|nr:maturation protein [ssRNA phage SRR6960803_13]DAD52330.1 TPA_asm: maturation protein [ssRNA phage SRR6960803_13]
MPHGSLVRHSETNFPGTYFRSYYKDQRGYRGDGKEVLDYTMLECRSTHGSYRYGNPAYIDAPNSYSAYDFMSTAGLPSWSTPAANGAYEEFRESALGEQSQVGAALAEWEQSLGMIGRRARQLAQSVNALRQRDFSRLLKVWKARPHPRHSRAAGEARKAANLWLEYSFGWKPLLGDIKSACDQISDKVPDGSRHQGSRSDDQTYTIPVGWATYRYRSTVTHYVGGYVKLTNPNLYLASQMGLVNPLSVAWEATPGSFIADWMFDIGSFLGAMSDFIGTSVTGAWRSSICRFHDTMDITNGTPAFAIGVAFVRRSGLYYPMPNLEIRRNVGSSINRAANAVALVTQALTSPDRIG